MLENLIPRLHVFEWEDQEFFPKNIRGYMQDYLNLMSRLGRSLFKIYAAKLKGVLQKTGDRHLVDLCSGSGGPVVPIVYWLKQMDYPCTAQLTDFFPNAAAFADIEAANPEIRGERQPINAMQVPSSIKGFRIICNAFHHFRPESARKILADAVAQGSGIAVLEVVSRTVPGFLQMFVGVGLMPLMTPFIRPFRWGRLFFTYIVPLVPLATIWDGIVSCLRVYSPRELRVLAEGLSNDYVWDIGTLKPGMGQGTITYLFGYRPKH